LRDTQQQQQSSDANGFLSRSGFALPADDDGMFAIFIFARGPDKNEINCIFVGHVAHFNSLYKLIFISV
jgi:hypothetical protein